MKLAILLVYLSGLVSILPTLAVALAAGGVSWVGVRAVYQTVLLFAT